MPTSKISLKSGQQIWAILIPLVMLGLVPGIHVFAPAHKKGVDGRDKPGHDDK